MEITNDSRTVAFVEDPRSTFDVQTGGRSGTPTVEIPVINGNMIEVTCQFIASNPNGGFTYEIKSVSNDAVRLTTRGANIVEKTAGWQSCVRTDYFLAKLPQATADEDATFEVMFDAGGLSNPGEAGSFLLTAKVIGSKLIG